VSNSLGLKITIDISCDLDNATFNLFLSNAKSKFLGKHSTSDDVIEIIVIEPSCP
jgi:hypothetical protein